MHASRYHKFLRISLVAVALVLLFDSGIVVPISKELSDNTVLYLANATGVSLSVPENELNKITTELTRREQELNERETILNQREIATRNFETGDVAAGSNFSTYVLAIILFILTVLIVLNYTLDFARSRKLAYEQAS